MFLLWMQLTAAAIDPPPDKAAPPAAAESTSLDPTPASSTDVPPSQHEAPAPTPMERALATEVRPGLPWQVSLATTIRALGEPTSQHAEMRCWLFEHTATSCTYWHLTAGTSADLQPGGDSTPVVRFVGAGRANGSSNLPPCCQVP